MLSNHKTTMTLVDPPAMAPSICGKCHQRIAPPSHPRPTFVTNILHSPNSLFRQHKSRSSGGGVCECPSSDRQQTQPQQQQQHQRQLGGGTTTSTTTTPLSPRPVELIHGNHNNNHDGNENDDGLETIEVALKHVDDSPHPVIFQPLAGSSTIQLKDEEDGQHRTAPTNHSGITWQRPGRNLSPIRIRSLHYRQNKTKQPSPCDLYQCVAVDFVQSSHRLCPMSSRVQLPLMLDNDGTSPSATNYNNKTWHAPDLFVVSISLPAKAGKKKNGGDDHSQNSRHQEQQQRETADATTTATTTTPVEEVEGCTVSMYFRMTAETRAILQRVTSPTYQPPQAQHHHNDNTSSVNAVKLFDDWCRKSPTDPKFQGRFKLIPHIHNPKEIGLPTWMAAYNAKPLLIKRSGTTGILYAPPPLSSNPSSSHSPSVLEFEVNFHPFPFLARQALQHLMEHSFDKLQLTLAFLIEGRSEDELPECLVGQAHFCHPQVKSSATAESFFASATTTTTTASESATKETTS